jgi:hypothetical protein
MAADVAAELKRTQITDAPRQALSVRVQSSPGR